MEDWQFSAGTVSECGMMGGGRKWGLLCWGDLIERGVNPGQRTG